MGERTLRGEEKQIRVYTEEEGALLITFKSAIMIHRRIGDNYLPKLVKIFDECVEKGLLPEILEIRKNSENIIAVKRPSNDRYK